MDSIMGVARERNVAVLEDVAQALGGTWRDRRLGTLGNAGAFSFFPSKNLGGFGDAGLVATDDDEVATSVRMLRAHGSMRKYFNETIGYNSRLDALQAALLRVKLPRLDAWNDARREAAARYRDLLSGLPGLQLPVERPGAKHVYHQYTVRVKGGRRDAIKEALAEQGIETMVYYPKCMHELPVYARAVGSFPSAEAACREVLSLPMWPRIERDVQGRVATAIRDAIGRR
jgi:dTDP-4-amino-4,6-dideoxygalactose transaminase